MSCLLYVLNCIIRVPLNLVGESAIKPKLWVFGDNNHAIRELMRFIEMTSRDLYSRMLHETKEPPIINVDGFKLKGGLNSFIF